MIDWHEATRRMTQRMRHHMASARLIRAGIADVPRQELVMIPGMTAAPEPCCLPERYDETRHPAYAIVQLKANGIRGIATPGRIVTREALPFEAALHCRPALDRLEAAYGEPMVFDGEYVEEEGFEATLSAFKRREGAGVFWLFDAVPYREWRANTFTEPLEQRLDRLAALSGALDSPFAGMLTGWKLDAAKTRDKASEIWAAGYEGLVVKNARSLYSRGRSFDWMKVKRKHTLDLIVRDVVVKDGKLVSLLADHGGRVVKVTAGIPDVLRVEIGRHPELVTGELIEIGHGDITSKGALTGVHFIGLRADRPQQRRVF